MQTGGQSYPVELGRRDGRISTKASVQRQLPHPDSNLDQLNAIFASHGLNQRDMIALSGTQNSNYFSLHFLSLKIKNKKKWLNIIREIVQVYQVTSLIYIAHTMNIIVIVFVRV